MPDMYKLGVSSALARVGLSSQKDESHLGRNLALGGLATSPFWGLIGQRKRIHDPDLVPGKRLSLEELEQLARPGDVVVSGRGNGLSRQVITDTATSHAEPVLGRRGGRGIGITPGELTPKQLRLAALTNPDLAETYARHAARIQRDPRAAQQLQQTLAPRLRNLEQSRAILLRPTTPLTPTQIKAIRDTGYREAATPWSASRGLKNILRDWFVPKHELFGGRTPGTVCTDNICTTHAGKALEAGGVSNLTPGKSTKDLMSSDFLSSDKFKRLGYYEGAEFAKSMPRLRKALHYGLRGGLGLGLAGGAYALSEDPYLAAVPLGAYGTAAAARHLLGHKTFRPIREAILSPKAKRLARLKNIGTRTLPLMLAGGLGTYLATRALPALSEDSNS